LQLPPKASRQLLFIALKPVPLESDLFLEFVMLATVLVQPIKVPIAITLCIKHVDKYDTGYQ
jgi:hypothetical protein